MMIMEYPIIVLSLLRMSQIGGISTDQFQSLLSNIRNFRDIVLHTLNTRDRNLVYFFEISPTAALYAVFAKCQTLAKLY